MKTQITMSAALVAAVIMIGGTIMAVEQQGRSPVADAALIYKTPTGTLKDNCVIWHKGTFHLFTMYRAKDKFDGMWAATSKDGVHWQDVGPVIKDAPFIIWAMRVWRAGDRFILNHGSFTGNNQDVLRFWESKDLIHWTYLGAEYDVRRPDGKRLDHMSVLPVEQDGKTQWYGYACGGLLRSEDGVRWKWVSDFDTPKGFAPYETGACERLGKKFYLLSGNHNCLPGDASYGVRTLISDKPDGPFLPDYTALRLHGNSGAAPVAIWAAFCRTPDEVLLSNYICDQHHQPQRWWHAPLKKAVYGDGHLRMGYWKGNDALKGEAIVLQLEGSALAFPSPQTSREEASVIAEGGRIRVSRKPGPGWGKYFEHPVPRTSIALLKQAFDPCRGYVLEGQVTLDEIRGGRPAAGLFFEEGSQDGTAVFLHSYGLTEIGKARWQGDDLRFDCQDRTGYGCATVAGISGKRANTFRLLYRGETFELYLNDLLVQTFYTNNATGRVGFLVNDGQAVFENLSASMMSFAEP